MKKGFATILILGAVLAVLVLGVAVYLKQIQKPLNIPNQITTPDKTTPKQSPSPITQSDETANWKVYKSSHGWTVSYPPNMNLFTKSAVNEIELNGSDINISFLIEDNPKKLTVDQKVQEVLSDNKKCEIECYDLSSLTEQVMVDDSGSLLQHRVNVISDYVIYIPFGNKFLISSAYTVKNGFADNGQSSSDWENYPLPKTKEQFLEIIKNVHLQ